MKWLAVVALVLSGCERVSIHADLNWAEAFMFSAIAVSVASVLIGRWPGR